MEKAKIIKNGNVNFINLEFNGIKDKLFNEGLKYSSSIQQKQKIVYDENWALEKAVEIANQSICKSKRGVIIWNRGYGYISEGFNNIPIPFICDGSDKCKANCAKTAIHAEQQAILNNPDILDLSYCEMLHVKSVDGKAVFSEKPSCWQCSKLILASGLKYMWLYTKDGLIKWTAEDFHKETLKNNNLL